MKSKFCSLLTDDYQRNVVDLTIRLLLPTKYLVTMYKGSRAKQHDIISLGFELESYFSRTSSIYFLLAFDLVCAKTNTTANYHTLTTPYISQTNGNGLIFFSFTVYYQVCTKTKAF